MSADVSPDLARKNELTTCTHHPNYTRQSHYPDVSPPLLSSHRPRSSSESIRLSRQRIGLVHQQIQPLSSLQYRVDVLHHNVFAK